MSLNQDYINVREGIASIGPSPNLIHRKLFSNQAMKSSRVTRDMSRVRLYPEWKRNKMSIVYFKDHFYFKCFIKDELISGKRSCTFVNKTFSNKIFVITIRLQNVLHSPPFSVHERNVWISTRKSQYVSHAVSIFFLIETELVCFLPCL